MRILPSGKEEAEIVVVGGGPSGQDSLIGRPFTSTSGEMLFDQILGGVGVMRKDCLVMYCIQERGENPCVSEVVELIQKHPRKLIIAVGELALESLTGHSSIHKWRGSLITDIEFGPTPILAMIEPNEIIRDYSLLYLSKKDAQKARFILDGGTLDETRNQSITQYYQLKRDYGSSTEAYHALCSLLDDYLSAPCIAFDIETFPKAQAITIIGLARSEKESIVVPCIGEFSWDQTIDLVRRVGKVLEGPALKIGQNLDYDVQYLAQKFGIGVRNVWIDTMVAHSVMHPELSHSLATLTSLYTLHPYYKDMRKETSELNYSETAYVYNGLDCCYTYEIAMALYSEMLKTGTEELFRSIVMPATKTLVRMEFKGIKVDENVRQLRRQTMQESLTNAFKSPALDGVNPNSPKQVKSWFASRRITPTAMGKETTDEHALKQVRAKHPECKDFIDAILEVRGTRKIISTYLDAETSPDGRMQTTYRTSATDTGRISSSAGVFDTGMNLQNVPESQRDWFIPDDGLIFWECDANQIEARITAWMCQDEGYVMGFLDTTRDLHTENAMALFGIPREKAGKERTGISLIPGSTHTYRDIGKRATHAINYKIGPRKLREMLNELVPSMRFSEADAKGFIRKFGELRPGLVKWWSQVEKSLHRSRVLRTPFGRRRQFLQRLGDTTYRAAIAFLPQSTAADHVNRALSRVERRLEAIPGASVLLQVHDSIGGQCRPGDRDRVKEIVIEELMTPLPLEFRGIPLVIPAEFNSGPNWGKCK